MSSCCVQDGDEELTISFYERSRIKRIFCAIGYVITVGLLRLFFYWLPAVYVRATCNRLEKMSSRVDLVLVRDKYGRTSYRVLVSQSNSLVYFTFRKGRFVYQNGSFQKVQGLPSETKLDYFGRCQPLANDQVQVKTTLFGSNHIQINVKPIVRLVVTELLSPFYVFQLFSVLLWYNDQYETYATCIVLLSVVSLSLTTYQTRRMQQKLREKVGMTESVSVLRQDSLTTDNGTAQGGNGSFGRSVQVDSSCLVPGDIVEIPNHRHMILFDAVLISGKCVVNEAMLSGESVPITKTALTIDESSNAERFDVRKNALHCLFNGTELAMTRHQGNERVLAVVFRTGFATTKGELVRSILYPSPSDFKFERQSYCFIAALFGLSLIGMIYTIVVYVHEGIEAGEIVLRALDLVTIVVPPALPAALTFGIMFAQMRLKRQRIFCISPRKINVSGSADLVCFDKTGTLTEDGVDFREIRSCTDGQFASEGIADVTTLSPFNFGLQVMASCHSLTFIDDQIQGDPFDLKMFATTGWSLFEAERDNGDPFGLVTTVESQCKKIRIGIVKQFAFSSNLQRMSVIVRSFVLDDGDGSDEENDGFVLFTKGSPEMLSTLCSPSTVPNDFHQVLSSYTREGFRVLALAYKRLDRNLTFIKVQRLARADVEQDLHFLGLVVMENRLKPATKPAILNLQAANICSVMITGDNLLTAISLICPVLVQAEYSEVDDQPDKKRIPELVYYAFNDSGEFGERARSKSKTESDPNETANCADDNDQVVIEMEKVECLLKNSMDSGQYVFALHGSTWAVLLRFFPELVPKILVRGRVFARFSPKQKQVLVEQLQDIGYSVAMCGDGANDCGALKTAACGISLSSSEASVAAPFTSKVDDVSCVPTLIREGRAALVTSFGIFKYMASYSLLQFFSCILLYSLTCNLTDWEFLWIDMFCITSLSFTFGCGAAYGRLAKRKPKVSLLSSRTIGSIVGHLAINASLQVFAFLYLRHFPWYEQGRFVPNEDDDYSSYDNYAVFGVSAFQYVWLAFIFAEGPPYRQTILRNLPFMANLIVLTILCLVLILVPPSWIAELFELQVVPTEQIWFRILLVLLAMIALVVGFLFEWALVRNCCFRNSLSRLAARTAWLPCLNQQPLPYQRIDMELDRCSGKWPPARDANMNHVDELMEKLIPDSSWN